MATIDLNDVLRVVAEWDTLEGTIAQMVWHYLVTSGNGDDPDDVLDDIETNLATAWANIAARVSDEQTGSTIELSKYNDALHQWDGLVTHPLTGVDGSGSTDINAHGVAALVKIFTEASRRQARKYIPGLIEAQTTASVFVASCVTDLALFAADLDDPITAPLSGLTFGTFNVDPTSSLYETFSKATQSVQAEAVPAYQRRRRPGTGI